MVLRLPPRSIPPEIPHNTELFIIGDVHGRSHALSLCLEDIRETPKTADKRLIVFLGDLIDRGPGSLGAIKMAMDAQALADEVHILPGNHELMMVDAISGGSQSPWLLNGGITVLDELGVDWRIMTWSDVVDVLRPALPDGFEQCIRDAPSHVSFGELLCVHAGLNPLEDPQVHLARDSNHSGSEHWSTIRDAFLNWRGGWDWNGHEYQWGNRVVVHGHTPALSCLVSENEEVLRDCDKIDGCRAICLDGGAAVYDQVVWSRIWRSDSDTMLQINAVSSRYESTRE